MSDKKTELMELGANLRDIRESNGYSLDDVERLTRIRSVFISAIEDGNYDALPGMVFARGFVRTYCDFLHAGDLWEKYGKHLASEAGASVNVGLGDYTPPRKVFRKTSKTWVYLLLIACLCAAGYLIWQQRAEVKQTVESSAISQPDVATPTPAVVSMDIVPAEVLSASHITSQSVAVPVSRPVSGSVVSGNITSEDYVPNLSWMDSPSSQSVVAPPVAVLGSAYIEALGQCWVRVTQDGKKIFEGTMKAGDTREFSVNSVTSVRIGSPRRLSVRFGANTMAPVDPKGSSPKTIYLLPDGTVRDKKP